MAQLQQHFFQYMTCKILFFDIWSDKDVYDWSYSDAVVFFIFYFINRYLFCRRCKTVVSSACSPSWAPSTSGQSESCGSSLKVWVFVRWFVFLLPLRSLCFVKIRFQKDPAWSETGDRYLLKLFRDHLFHQVSEAGAPWIDLSHIVSCLNKVSDVFEMQ